ncbi:hypothetical protein V6N12_066878 [Hibiscus sabdariffa]|uniref:Uncharacterized protein n=1 Tax=Hibiscus sabdariffa TaxID=183260 RepID=A0ABR2CA54_9ROSI
MVVSWGRKLRVRHHKPISVTLMLSSLFSAFPDANLMTYGEIVEHNVMTLDENYKDLRDLSGDSRNR